MYSVQHLCIGVEVYILLSGRCTLSNDKAISAKSRVNDMGFFDLLTLIHSICVCVFEREI